MLRLLIWNIICGTETRPKTDPNEPGICVILLLLQDPLQTERTRQEGYRITEQISEFGRPIRWP